MKIKLRGKTWKQITIEEFNKLENSDVNNIGFFRDCNYNELTYFKEISQKQRKAK